MTKRKPNPPSGNYDLAGKPKSYADFRGDGPLETFIDGKRYRLEASEALPVGERQLVEVKPKRPARRKRT